ncbi:MAG TPA: asparagine synthase (glutamine-hydrolyzing) [Vicinamibacterales bacterium]|jgi:asparagine synthase (glutamine-hydrolysing)|nr:asparagine synthase (glutamine-hydrolyzing) [Vicinamibacterales bacterium]
MCGLAGIVDAGHRPIDPGVLERMRRVLHHRGPDDTAVAAVGASGFAASLGFCRLSIIDLSPLGAQPMTSADGSVTLVFNGEIYNHAELRRELQSEGVVFRSRSDTEALVELLARRWSGALPLLRGMFALAAVDRRNHRVILARDRVGKKPLFYRSDGARLAFASELKGLLVDPDTPRDIDPAGLAHYLRFQYVPAPGSILRNVRKVRPGHFVEWGGQEAVERRYWSLAFEPKLDVTFEEAVPAVRGLVEEAVRVRLESDVPLGAFLSGGIDSSVVTAVIARSLSTPVQTFSIGFNESRFDERPYAALVARSFGTVHREFVVSMDAVDALPQLAWAFDEPFADSSALPTFYVSRLTRQHVTVALSGDGGDEAFGGYERYFANLWASRLAPAVAWKPLRALGDAVLCGGSMPPSRTLRRAARRMWEGLRIREAPSRYLHWMSGMEGGTLRRLFPGGGPYWDQVDAYLIDGFRDGFSPAAHDLDRMQRLDLHTYLPDDLLVKVDRASMANSLEVRAPFLDHKLLEYLARLPVSVRNPRLKPKALLKAAFPELPSEIRDRRKTGFGVPVADWFRGGLGNLYQDSVLAADSRARQWFDGEALHGLFAEHRAMGADHSTALWTVLMFEHWHRAHIR